MKNNKLELPTKHTEGEWNIVRHLDKPMDYCIHSKGELICRMPEDSECHVSQDLMIRDYNALRIVKCVNMHDELISLLNECLEPLSPGEDCGLPVILYNKICEFLKQAEQK